ncbi:divalent-cation tolerance protein CutA [Erwinia endophytica]|uniref:divalent-cation tolerance protein CutA n=1 Tax=Erwinia endophytica TaxID=1563158 RepID=UPI001265E89D|nr:divalent-cation tolerance protein CutA [Erwinia endophytica]KAB8308013.1 divalent-cation tolerance protein CutA [Erwinia endophytica]
MSANSSALTAQSVTVYAPVPVNDDAVKLGRTIVAERLASAVNVIPGVTSYYWWEGELVEKGETILLFQTLQQHVPALVARIKQLHNYITPGVGAWPIVAGNEDWLQWINQQAQPSARQ